MFNGRITEIGVLLETGRRLVVRAPKTAGCLGSGGSVCVSGTCLSAVEIGEDWFATDMSEETTRRTTLAEHPVGAGVNLELPLRLGDSLDGHLVQGHTDAVGKVTAIVDTDGGRRMGIRPPRRFMDEVVAKGSVAVDGVSLTAAELLQDRFSVSLIPITLRETTLGSLQVNDRVNLESDLFVKSARELHASAPPCGEQVICRSALGRRAAWSRRGREDRRSARRWRGGDHSRP